MNANYVDLILNPKTGHAYLQYHCVIDDNFTTVSQTTNGTVPSNWADLVEPSSGKILLERYYVHKTLMAQDQHLSHKNYVQQYLYNIPSD